MNNAMIGKSIKLSPEEIRIVKFISECRFKENRKSNVTNDQYGYVDSRSPDIDGFAGEVCFAKLFNLYPDFSISVRSAKNSDEDYDFVLPCGNTVDVKATQHVNGRLIVRLHKKPKNKHLFALMTGENFEYTFKGFIHSDEIINPGRIIKLNSLVFAASQHELKELYEYNFHKMSGPSPCSSASTMLSSLL